MVFTHYSISYHQVSSMFGPNNGSKQMTYISNSSDINGGKPLPHRDLRLSSMERSADVACVAQGAYNANNIPD